LPDEFFPVVSALFPRPFFALELHTPVSEVQPQGGSLPTDPDDLLTTSQAARWLDLSARRVAQLADAGSLPCQRNPLGRLFKVSDVLALAKERAAKN
jgi:hypothetical protein